MAPTPAGSRGLRRQPRRIAREPRRPSLGLARDLRSRPGTVPHLHSPRPTAPGLRGGRRTAATMMGVQGLGQECRRPPLPTSTTPIPSATTRTSTSITNTTNTNISSLHPGPLRQIPIEQCRPALTAELPLLPLSTDPCLPPHSTTDPCLRLHSTTDPCLPLRSTTDPCLPLHSITGPCLRRRRFGHTALLGPCLPPHPTSELCRLLRR